MSKSAREPKKKRGKFLRLFLGGVVLLLVVGAVAFVYFTNIELYRPMIIAAMEEGTGLPAQLGAMELSLWPEAHLVVHDVLLGEGDLTVALARVEASVLYGGLLGGVVEVPTVALRGLTINLPKDFLEAVRRVDAVRSVATSGGGGTGSSGGGGLSFLVRLGQLTFDEVAVIMGNETALTGAIAVSDALTASPSVSIQTRVPYVGDDAGVVAEVTLQVASMGIEGIVELRNVDLSRAVGDAEVPQALVTVTASVSGTIPDDISVELSGDVATAVAGVDTGSIGAKVWWRDGQLGVNDFAWDSLGIKLAGNATVTPSTEEGGAMTVAANIPEARVTGMGLQMLLGLVSISGARLRSGAESHIAVTDFLLVSDDTGAMRFSEGDISLAGIDVVLTDGTAAISGLRGEVAISENTIQIASFGSDIFSVSGSVVPNFGVGTVALDLTGEATLDERQLAPWLPEETLERLRGKVTVERLAGTFGGEALLPDDLVVETRLQDFGAVVTVSGASAPMSVSGVTGGISLKDDVLTIDGLAGSGFRVDGTVAGDIEAMTGSFDLSAEVDLAKAPLSPFIPADTVSDLAGVVTLKRVSGRVVSDASMPEDLLVDGTFANGAFRTSMTGMDDSFSDISATFTTDSTLSVDFTLGFLSTELGEMFFDGEYASASALLKGALSLDVPKSARAYLDAETQALAGPVLARYGKSTVDMTLQLPRADAAGMSVAVSRRGAPTLTGQVAMAPVDEMLTLESVVVSGNFPLAWVPEEMWPMPVETAGAMGVLLDGQPLQERFSLVLDLTPAALGIGAYVNKAANVPFTVDIGGSVSPEAWTPETIDVEILGERVAATYINEVVRVANLDVNVGALAPLFPPEMNVTGRVQGSFAATDPMDVSLTLAGVGLALAPEVAIDSMDGAMVYRDSYVSADNLRVVGAGSDFTVNARTQEGPWSAKIAGPALNLNALLALQEAFLGESEEGAAEFPVVPEPVEAAAPSVPMEGNVSIALDSFLYQRGELNDVRMEVALEKTGMSVANLSLRPYTGSLEGSAKLVYASKDDPGSLDIDLKMTGGDLRIIDEMVLAKENYFMGTADGVIDIECPMGTTLEMLKAVDGLIFFSAEDGSYGKMGLATKLLTVLKTTSVVQLRLPWVPDKGLTYQKSEANIQMKDGVVTIEQFLLEDRAYALEASGVVDYPADTMDITAKLRVLEAVTDILEMIPLLSKVVEKVKKRSGVSLHIGGAPFNPKIEAFAVEPEEDETTAEVAEESEAPAEEATTKDKVRSLLDAAGGLFKRKD